MELASLPLAAWLSKLSNFLYLLVTHERRILTLDQVLELRQVLDVVCSKIPARFFFNSWRLILA